VKHLRSTLLFTLIVGPVLVGQGIPVPRGIRQADQTESQTQQSIPPPAAVRARIDVAKLREEADELSRIAQTIPGDAASIQLGRLPVDTVEKLRQIEKLSKRLRSALTH
jgi:hypothetical protein